MSAIKGPPKVELTEEVLFGEEPQRHNALAEAAEDPSVMAPLIPNYLPAGRIHLMGASPSAGKSTLIAQLAESGTKGLDFFGLPCNKKDVRFIFTDRTAASCLTTLDALGLSVPYLSFVDTPEILEYERQLMEGTRKTLYGIKLLERALDMLGTPPGSVIVSDVHTNAFLGDISQQRTLGPYMRHTAALCIKRRITLIMVCYGVKIVGDQQALYRRLVDRIIGAPSLRGSSDGLMYLTTAEESGGKANKNGQWPNIQQFQIISRTAPPWERNLVNKNGLFYLETPEEANARSAVASVAEEKPRACEVILPHVPFGEGVGPAAIYESYRKGGGKEVTGATLNGWLESLKLSGKIDKPKYGVWRRLES